MTAVWVPDAAHEAMRDLVRARATAIRVAGKARQHMQGFLLRHGRVCPGRKGWTRAYRRFLTTIRFDHAPAQQIALQDYIHAVTEGERWPCQFAQCQSGLSASAIGSSREGPMVRCRISQTQIPIRQGGSQISARSQSLSSPPPRSTPA